MSGLPGKKGKEGGKEGLGEEEGGGDKRLAGKGGLLSSLPSSSEEDYSQECTHIQDRKERGRKGRGEEGARP